MKNLKKVICVILCGVLLTGSTPVTAFAAPKSKVTVVSVFSKKKSATLKISTKSKAKKYQVKYATNRKFKKGKIVTVKVKKKKLVVKGLKPNKTYYFRVRVKGKKKWSNRVFVKTKKAGSASSGRNNGIDYKHLPKGLKKLPAGSTIIVKNELAKDSKGNYYRYYNDETVGDGFRLHEHIISDEFNYKKVKRGTRFNGWYLLVKEKLPSEAKVLLKNKVAIYNNCIYACLSSPTLQDKGGTIDYLYGWATNYFDLSESEYARLLINTYNTLNISNNMSNLEKYMVVSRYEFENITYDYSFTYYDSYSALKTKTCVCQGYAELTKALCFLANVPCYVLRGGNHAWNCIRLDDGYWYQTDATGNDLFACVVFQKQQTLGFPEKNDTVFDRGFVDNEPHSLHECSLKIYKNCVPHGYGNLETVVTGWKDSGEPITEVLQNGKCTLSSSYYNKASEAVIKHKMFYSFSSHNKKMIKNHLSEEEYAWYLNNVNI